MDDEPILKFDSLDDLREWAEKRLAEGVKDKEEREELERYVFVLSGGELEGRK